MTTCRIVQLPASVVWPAPERAMSHHARLRAAGERLWEAWRSLDDWETRAGDTFGAELGELLLLLWTAQRFRANDAAVVVLCDAIDAGVVDPLMSDVATLAFALGAGWGRSLAHSAERRPPG